eukprot:scaffold208489_cov39-Tisochrysis_lutea.AAC.2
MIPRPSESLGHMLMTSWKCDMVHPLELVMVVQSSHLQGAPAPPSDGNIPKKSGYRKEAREYCNQLLGRSTPSNKGKRASCVWDMKVSRLQADKKACWWGTYVEIRKSDANSEAIERTLA